MNDIEADNLPLGLDVGTSRIVVARNSGKKYQYDAQLNAFITLPYSKLAKRGVSIQQSWSAPGQPVWLIAQRKAPTNSWTLRPEAGSAASALPAPPGGH